jgi:class 3 adenylate cyclase
VVALGMAVIVGLASKIEHHSEYQRKLRDDDPQVLLAEYIDIQKRLNPGPREVTVVVVDAARSSLMKQMSDPFVAEWSFRAYQQVIERVTYEHGGEVLATAGDGAVLTFKEPAQGLTASRAILEKVDDFNERTNKLSMPFQLRIGVHSGQISGFINQVQYAEVIDVAAHIEAAAQIGGIAVSEKIMEQIEGLDGEKLSIAIDGFEVFQLA